MFACNLRCSSLKVENQETTAARFAFLSIVLPCFDVKPLLFRRTCVQKKTNKHRSGKHVGRQLTRKYQRNETLFDDLLGQGHAISAQGLC